MQPDDSLENEPQTRASGDEAGNVTADPDAPEPMDQEPVDDLPSDLLRAAPNGDLWKVIFDSSPFACSIVDIASERLVVNRAYRRLLGIGDHEPISLDDVRRRAHPDELEMLTELFEPLNRGEMDHVEVDRRYVRDDGGILWGHLVTTLIRDGDGSPVAIVGSVEDITHRVDEQRELIARFEAGFEHSPVGMAVIDENGRIERANPALCRMSGQLGENLVGEHLASLTASDDPIDEHALDGLLARRLDVHVLESRFDRPDGETVWTHLTISPLSAHADGLQGLFVQIEDVTEQRNAELALAHQATHDPLTSLGNRRHFPAGARAGAGSGPTGAGRGRGALRGHRSVQAHQRQPRAHDGRPPASGRRRTAHARAPGSRGRPARW